MLLKTHFNRIWFAFQLFSETLLHCNNKVKSVADDCHSTLTFPVDASSFNIILYFGFGCVSKWTNYHQWMCKKY